MLITQAELHEMFEYIGGHLYRRSTGKQAGTNTADGYRRIIIDGYFYLEHRLIWLMFKGEIYGEESIIHLDGVKDNNRIENLKLVGAWSDEMYEHIKSLPNPGRGQTKYNEKERVEQEKIVEMLRQADKNDV